MEEEKNISADERRRQDAIAFFNRQSPSNSGSEVKSFEQKPSPNLVPEKNKISSFVGKIIKKVVKK